MTLGRSSANGYRTDHGFRVGFAVVITALAGVAGACAGDSAAPVEQLRIVALTRFDGGGAPGGPPFGRIADIEIGEDETVYVLDALSRNIRVFDDRGTELRAFGERGAGPGELEGPVALFWGPEGNLWVADNRHARFTVFETDGSLIATYPVAGPILADPPTLRFSEDGRLRAVAIDLPGGSLEAAKIVLVEYDLGDGEARPRAQFDLPFAELPEPYEYRANGAVLILSVPFSGEPMFSLDDSGHLWYAQAREPSVHRWSVSSGADLTLGRELEPVSVTPAERQEALDDMLTAEDRALIGQEGLTDLRGMIPDTKPYLSGFFLDDAERVWLLHAPTSGSDGLHDMDVYDSTEGLVAIARAPLMPEPKPRIRDGLLAGVVRDELGVESVALYRVPR